MDLKKVQAYIDRIYSFVEKHSGFGDCHMVDFLTHDHWGSFVSNDVQQELLATDCDGTLYDMFGMSANINEILHKDVTSSCGKITDLRTFLSEARSNSVFSLDVLTQKAEIGDFFNDSRTSDQQNVTPHFSVEVKEFMNTKKSYEVDLMAPVVHQLAHVCNTSNILDIGAGKGYLSAFLSLRYGLTVTGVDIAESNCVGALTRAKKYKSYMGKLKENRSSGDSVMKFDLVNAKVDGNSKMEKTFFPDDDEGEGGSSCVCVGLHTCGNLCSTVVSLFVNEDSIRGLCVVGCCYHQLYEECDQDNEVGFPLSSFVKSRGYKLGRNKRMLALKVPEKHSEKTPTSIELRKKSELSLFYRAVLSVILRDKLQVFCDDKKSRIGKIFSKSSSFVEYVRKSITKLKLNNELVSDDEIEAMYERYLPRLPQLVAFSLLREAYAPAVESIIILDKLCYLLELKQQGLVKDCHAVQLFDRVKSPRCVALIATKS